MKWLKILWAKVCSWVLELDRMWDEEMAAAGRDAGKKTTSVTPPDDNVRECQDVKP